MKFTSCQWYAFLLFALLFSAGSLVGCGGSSSGDDSAPVTEAPDDDDGENGDDPDDNDDSDDTVEPLTCDNPTYDDAMNLRIYQVMTGSFIDGDAGKGYGVGYGSSHHNGDLRGIIDSLEYIEELGFNAIWLTPVFESVPLSDQDWWADRLDATGYYASHYFNIDPNFGTMDEARELVEKAHELGLYVFFDGVFGHFKENAGDYPSIEGHTVSNGGDSVADVGRVAQYPEDLDFFREVATYWIEELKIDGWRLDQAYQVPLDDWIEIRRAVEETSNAVTYTNAEGDTVNPLGYMVAEIWDGEETIAEDAYGTDDEPALCSAFDFPMRYALVQSLAVEESGDSNHTAARLRAGFNTHDAYPDQAVPNGFVGNHDLVRLGDLLQRGDIADPEDDAYWRRHKAVYSFLAAYSGPITLYYGEEIGDQVPGFDDEVEDCIEDGLCEDNVARNDGKIEGLPSSEERETFTANESQADLRDYVRELMHLRADEPALYRGERTSIVVPTDVADSLYADYKTHDDEAIIFLLNVGDTAVDTHFDACALGTDGELTDLMSGETVAPEDGQYRIEVPPTTGRFFKVESPSDEGPGCQTGGDITGEGPMAECDRPDSEESGPLDNTFYVRGDYAGGDNFGATPSERAFRYKGDGLYQVVVEEPEATAYGFKFADADWNDEFAVAGSADVILGAEQDMAVASGPGTESSVEIPEAGDYVFSFTLNGEGDTLMVSQCAE